MTRVLQILSIPKGDRIGVNGPEIRTYNLIKYWKSADVEPVIAYHKEGMQWKRLQETGVRLLHFNWIHLGSFFALYSIVRNVKPNLIHNQGPIPLDWMVAIVGKLLGVPVLITRPVLVDDLIGHSKLHRAIYRFLDWMSAKLSVHYIAICEDGLRGLVNRDEIEATRVQLVYNGIDPSRFLPIKATASTGAIEQTPVVLGMVGQLSPVKGWPEFIEVIARLRKDGLNVRGLIVGDGSLWETLNTQVKELGLDAVITFAGYDSNVAPFLSKMDIFLFPSHREGLSVAILEAMATGLPIVATNVGGTREQVIDGKNGFLLEARDVDGLTQCAQKLVVDASLRKNMGQRSRKFVEEKFSEQAMFEGHVQCYQQLGQ